MCVHDGAVLREEDTALLHILLLHGLVAVAEVAVGIYAGRIEFLGQLVGAGQSAIGREADIHAVVVVEVSLEEPAIDVVLHAQAEGRQRSAAHAHILGDDLLCHGLIGHGVGAGVELLDFVGAQTLVVDLCVGVVGVFGIAIGSHEVHGEVGSNLVVKCSLQSVVHLLDARHGEVGEGAHLVVVVGRLFRLVAEEEIVARHLGRESADAECVGSLATEDFLHLEVVHEVVLDARCHETIARQRCLGGGHSSEGQDVVGRGAEGHLCASATAEEAAFATLAVGDVGRLRHAVFIDVGHLSAAVLHQALALHDGSVHVARKVEGEEFARELVLRPEVAPIDVDVVVVAKLIADTDLSVGVVEVVLCLVAAHAVVVGGKLVDVRVAGCAEEVVHRLVVHTLRMVEAETSGVFVITVDLLVEGGVDGRYHLVVVATLQVVECLTALCFVLAIDVVHTVPVDLLVGFGGAPVVHEGVVLVQQEGVLVEVVGVVLVGVVDVEDA